LLGLGVGLSFIPALLSVELHFPREGNTLATTIALSGIGESVYVILLLASILVIYYRQVYSGATLVCAYSATPSKYIIDVATYYDINTCACNYTYV